MRLTFKTFSWLSAFFLSMLFLSCNSDLSSEDVNSENIDVINITETIPTSLLVNPLALDGALDFIITEQNDLIIYHESYAEHHLFVVQKLDKVLPGFVNIRAISYLDHVILIETDKQILYVGVEKPEEQAILQHIGSDQMKDVSKIYGAGVIHKVLDMSIDSSHLFNFEVAKNMINPLEYILFGDSQTRASCTYGGPGATSCSASGDCSVSCAAGYYACCNPSDWNDVFNPVYASCYCVPTEINNGGNK